MTNWICNFSFFLLILVFGILKNLVFYFYISSAPFAYSLRSRILVQDRASQVYPGFPLTLFLKGIEEGNQAEWSLVLSRENGFLGYPCSPNNFATSQLRLNKNFSVIIPGQTTRHFNKFDKLYVCINNFIKSDSQWIHLGQNSIIYVCNKILRILCMDKPSTRQIRQRRSLNSSTTPVSVWYHQNISSDGLSTPSSEILIEKSVTGNKIHSDYVSMTEGVSSNRNDNVSGEYFISEVVPFNVTTENVLINNSLKTYGNTPKRRERTVDSSQNSFNGVVFNLSNEEANKLSGSVRIFGMHLETESKEASYDNGTIALQAGYPTNIRLFGIGLTQDVYIQFTAYADQYGAKCDKSTSNVFPLQSAHGYWAILPLALPVMSPSQKYWYICVRNGEGGDAVHQGPYYWLTLSTYTLLLPIWIQVIMLVVLLVLSGLFSGLNLGLMALDKTELKIVMNTGTPMERQYAKAIEPVRRHGNFLLCTLLLGNVLVNSTLTILLDTLSSGLVAVIGSTIGIVIFGEIVPQAICSRHGLSVGARTVWLVRIFMVITGAISWPISKILDLLLGEEIGNTYDRDRLKELIRVTQDRNNLRLEEQNIIYGALELHQKTAAQVMTKIDDIFMLSIDCNLDFNTINEIMQQGYSRIPIYDCERTNIVSVLLIKDLAFIDPDDNTPLRTVTQFYQNACSFFFEDTTLDVIFKEFKHGNKGHMGFVQRVNNEGDCDPFYEVIGLVTLEDVIEELIQEEIVDETDVFTDNKSKRRRKQIRRNFKEFSQRFQNSSQKRVQISPHLQVAAFQFLRTSVEPFKEGQLSEGILKRMLNQDVVYILKGSQESGSGSTSEHQYIYMQNKPCDFFVLILEGHVEVEIGKESLTFESGPFTYFGLPTLSLTSPGESPSTSNQAGRGSIVDSLPSMESSKFSFTPDYSVKVNTQVTFLKIRRSHYIAARRAFLVERSQKDSITEETFDLEVQKILQNESQNSPPVWDTESSIALKEALLNGGSGVQRYKKNLGDDGIKNSENDHRKFSVKELLPMKSLTPSSPNRRRSSGTEKNGTSDAPAATVAPAAAVTMISSKVPEDDDGKEDLDSALRK